MAPTSLYCILPNTAPARTPKNSEGREYSGLNQTMSGGCGDSRTCSFVFNEGKSSVHIVSPAGRDSGDSRS